MTSRLDSVQKFRYGYLGSCIKEDIPFSRNEKILTYTPYFAILLRDGPLSDTPK